MIDVSVDALAQIERAISQVRFGHVQVVIHDGRIVGIEKVERIRLTGIPPTSPPKKAINDAREGMPQ